MKKKFRAQYLTQQEEKKSNKFEKKNNKKFEARILNAFDTLHIDNTFEINDEKSNRDDEKFNRDDKLDRDAEQQSSSFKSFEFFAKININKENVARVYEIILTFRDIFRRNKKLLLSQ